MLTALLSLLRCEELEVDGAGSSPRAEWAETTMRCERAGNKRLEKARVESDQVGWECELGVAAVLPSCSTSCSSPACHLLFRYREKFH